MEISQENKSHFVQIYGCEKLETNAIKEILSSTDKEVIAKVDNNIMVVFGEELTILKLIPETGELCIKGKIQGVKYNNNLSKKSFFKRVFK